MADFLSLDFLSFSLYCEMLWAMERERETDSTADDDDDDDDEGEHEREKATKKQKRRRLVAGAVSLPTKH